MEVCDGYAVEKTGRKCSQLDCDLRPYEQLCRPGAAPAEILKLTSQRSNMDQQDLTHARRLINIQPIPNESCLLFLIAEIASKLAKITLLYARVTVITVLKRANINYFG